MPLRTVNREHAVARKGRGAGINPEGRFEGLVREAFDDGWVQAPAAQEARGSECRAQSEGRQAAHGAAPALETHVTIEQAKRIISRNDSPDIPFSQSINPYRGCEHGCIYCYARPSHAYLNLSPGIDFETRLFAKANAAELLRAELSRPGYTCDMIALGANTDPYQPIERRYRITHGILEVLAECEHPVGIVTKNALVERDIDILSRMAKKNLVRVFISLNNLDPDLARRLEPRCSAPARRLEAYTGTYLQQEIVAEGATRNVPAFSRFLRVAALCNATLVNFTNVASDAQVPRTTVYEYFDILKETLLLQEVPAWRASAVCMPSCRPESQERV